MSNLEWDPLFLLPSSVVSGFVDCVATGPCQVHSRSVHVIYDPLFLRYIWVNYSDSGRASAVEPALPMINNTLLLPNHRHYAESLENATFIPPRNRQPLQGFATNSFDYGFDLRCDILSVGLLPGFTLVSREFYDSFEEGSSRNRSLDSDQGWCPISIHIISFSVNGYVKVI